MIKDAQKHFGSVLGYESKSKKNSKLNSTNFGKKGTKELKLES
jgi:hypothetical protein